MQILRPRFSRHRLRLPAPERPSYELKQWADSTLRFYWVSPAMSQIYTELARLRDRGLVDVREDGAGERW